MLYLINYFFYIYDNTHLDNRDKKLLAACVYFWCFIRYSGIIDVIKESASSGEGWSRDVS